MATKHTDLYQEVTDKIVSSLATAGEWERPWTLIDGAFAPVNTAGRAYRGVNVWLLWASALEHGYTSGVWGTYKAWKQDDPVRHVRKGEKGTLVTLWKPTHRKATARDVAEGNAKRVGASVQGLYLRDYTVFNSEQVEGYVAPAAGPKVDPIAEAERFFDAIGATILPDPQAHYSPITDTIGLPPIDAFVDAGAYYATSAHEHGHWTGHKSRLDRDLVNRFGSEAYAFEELVAELTAAFVGARLGIEPTVREDHASYVKNWIKVLKNDKKAIFTAGSLAQKATDFLAEQAGIANEAYDPTNVALHAVAA